MNIIVDSNRELERDLWNQSISSIFSNFKYYLLDSALKKVNIVEKTPNFHCKIIFWKQFHGSVSSWWCTMSNLGQRYNFEMKYSESYSSVRRSIKEKWFSEFGIFIVMNSQNTLIFHKYNRIRRNWLLTVNFV